MSERDVMQYDVVIVGAGPAGLACAIRLKQLKPELGVCVIEKASVVGAQILSGAVIEPQPLVQDATVPLPAVVSVQVDGDRQVIEAEREIVLRCGDASITLTRAGKVIIQGNYILSRSTGHNKIKGAAIDIN